MSSRILSVLAVIVTLTLCPRVKAKDKSEAEALVDMFKTNRASLVKLRVSIDDFVVSLLSKQQNLTDASVLRELEGAVDRLWTKADNITTSLAQFAQLLPGSRHHPKKGILVRIRLPERFDQRSSCWIAVNRTSSIITQLHQRALETPEHSNLSSSSAPGQSPITATLFILFLTTKNVLAYYFSLE